MRAIVTGGAGFIGSHVVEALLARGDEVTVVDDLSNGKRENVPEGARLVERDIRDGLGDVFDEARPEVCFHLAAQVDVRVSVERPEHDASVNVLGTIEVLEAARAHDAQVVFSSTGGAIYGECDGPAPEDAERRPLAPYGVSKLAGEEYLAAYNRLYGTRHVSLRYGNVYGPRQDPHGEAGVVAIFLGRSPRARRRGSSATGRRRATTSTPATWRGRRWPRRGHDGGVFNVGTGSETSVVELYERLPPRRGVDARSGAGARAARRAAAQRARRLAGRAGARLAPGGGARRGPAPDLGVHHGVAGGQPRRRIGRSAVEHALPHPARPAPGRQHPWRTIAVVATAIAMLELLGLVVVGDRAAGETVLAPRRAPQAAPRAGREEAPRRTDRAAAPAAARLGDRAERQRRLRRRSRRGLARARARVHRRRGRKRAARQLRPDRGHVPRRPPREALRLARDLGIRRVSPLDGLRAATSTPPSWPSSSAAEASATGARSAT